LLRPLGLPTPADVIALVLVTLPAGGGTPTANFYAPVALNLRAGLGVQLMPAQDRYGVAHPIPWRAILPEPVLTALEAEDATGVPAA
jgi:flagellar assembly factor FliW